MNFWSHKSMFIKTFKFAPSWSIPDLTHVAGPTVWTVVPLKKRSRWWPATAHRPWRTRKWRSLVLMKKKEKSRAAPLGSAKATSFPATLVMTSCKMKWISLGQTTWTSTAKPLLRGEFDTETRSSTVQMMMRSQNAFFKFSAWPPGTRMRKSRAVSQPWIIFVTFPTCASLKRVSSAREMRTMDRLAPPLWPRQSNSHSLGNQSLR